MPFEQVCYTVTPYRTSELERASNERESDRESAARRDLQRVN
jgi:hypothetical protein